MIGEFRKSINAILYQRVASPLYGTFILSWLIWNWQPLYITLFVSESKLEANKLSYIVSNYNNVWNLIWWPLVSTLVILTLGQLIANGAFWLDEEFKNWRVKKRDDIQKNKMITVEESIELRTTIRNQNEEFQKFLSDKEAEVASYKSEVSGLNGRISMLQDELKAKGTTTVAEPLSPFQSVLPPSPTREEDIIYKKLISNENLRHNYSSIWIEVRDEGKITTGENYYQIREFIIANKLAVKGTDNNNNPIYQPTDLGNKVYQLYVNEQLTEDVT